MLVLDCVSLLCIAVSFFDQCMFFPQIALFFHILLTMATDISKEDFECGKPSGSYGKSTRTGVKKMTDEEMDLMTGARKTLWTHLRGMKVKGGKNTTWTDRQTDR